MSIKEVREALKGQLSYRDDLSGRVLDRTLKVGDTLYIIFKDNSFVAYAASKDYDGYVELDITNEVPSYYTLRDMKLISDEACAKQHKAELASQEARNKNLAKRQAQQMLRTNKAVLLEVLVEEGIIEVSPK